MEEDVSTASGLPEHLELQRTRVICGPDMNSHTESTLSAHQYAPMGTSQAFSLAKFKKGFNITITKYEGDDMEFELKGISCAMANSLRRIMIAEAPTMAIEHVYILNNTSIIQDEVLSHRLGLIPLRVDPRLFKYKVRGGLRVALGCLPGAVLDCTSKEENATQTNTIVLKLKVECRRLPDGSVENDKVYSKDLQWLPEGSEIPAETGARFGESQATVVADVRPTYEDILIAKLRPGQAIELEAHCVKGVGEEHAKWSPVATTWYKLMPEVVLLQPVTGDLADELAAECPGLFQVVERGGSRAVMVADPRQHWKQLEKVRRLSGEERWSPYLQLRKVKDHFIFTVESTGAWRPHELFNYAVDVMVSKCDKVLEGLQTFPSRSFDY
ncbi:hypothetical protein N2152v2_006967 [Parachlorella kessleri]